MKVKSLNESAAINVNVYICTAINILLQLKFASSLILGILFRGFAPGSHCGASVLRPPELAAFGGTVHIPRTGNQAPRFSGLETPLSAASCSVKRRNGDLQLCRL